MGVMLYRQGRGTRVWGKEYQTIVVNEEGVEVHKKDGWYCHPDEVKSGSDNQEKIKRPRKVRADTDADKD